MTSVSTRVVFAFLPHRLADGGWVWLRRVVRRRTRIQNWAGILDEDQYFLPKPLPSAPDDDPMHRGGGRP